MGATAGKAGAKHPTQDIVLHVVSKVPHDVVVRALHVSTGSSLLTDIGIGVGAVAAIGAATSAWVARRALIQTTSPRLHFVLGTGADGWPSVMTIQNVGQDVAVLPGYVLTSGSGGVPGGASHQTNGYIGHNLAPGEKVRIGIPFSTSAGAVGAVYCEDGRNRVHVWGSDRQHFKYKLPRRNPLTSRKVLDSLAPGLGTNLDDNHWLPSEELDPPT